MGVAELNSYYIWASIGYFPVLMFVSVACQCVVLGVIRLRRGNKCQNKVKKKK
jgi:hypothetical protein